MAYNLAYTETLRVPIYETRTWIDNRGNVCDVLTKTPTGQFFERTFKSWRCSICRAWFVGESAPAECGNVKCGSR